ncbi:MAG: hypothetical protein ACRC33_27255 [Gemmataceae bacterium]
MPPWSEVQDALLRVVLPAAGAAASVFLLIRLLGRERLTPLAAAAALAAGVVAGVWCREPAPLLPEGGLLAALGNSLERPPAGADVPRPYFWLTWSVLAALLVDVLARLPRVPPSAGWAARALVAACAPRRRGGDDLRNERPWLPWALAASSLALWAVGHELGRGRRGGLVPLVYAAAFAAAGVVLLHAHTARLTDLALIPAFALFAVAAAAALLPGDAGAAAAAAVYLPGLMLIGQQGTFSDVPTAAFALAGLSPLAALPVPLRGWKGAAAQVGLPLLVAAAAVALAMRAESVEF